jgi:hypothetical protein
MELRDCNRFVFFLLVMVLLAVTSQPYVHGLGSIEAMHKINDAKVSLTDAFRKVADAESAGGNVSSLIGRMNEAVGYLDLAKIAYVNGDFDVAYYKASECSSLAGNVAGDAIRLKGQAAVAAGGWWIVVGFSVVGALIFSLVLYSVWVWFRRSYARRVSQMKPEVVD